MVSLVGHSHTTMMTADEIDRLLADRFPLRRRLLPHHRDSR